MPSQYEEERVWEASNHAHYEAQGNDDVIENPEEVLHECLEKFKTPDYIMEPGIFGQLKRYFQAGGNPEQVIEQLSINYNAVAQMANLLAEWLILGGVKVTEVQAMVENHLKDMILKTFDPKKADTIFTEEGETPAWLTEMIEHPTWRSLIYRLAEEYPDCLMLNFTIKLISDAGFQGEITSISTAAQQIEVFSRVLKSAIVGFLQSSDDWQNSVNECAKMVCHGAHTYVYSQVIVHILSQEHRGGAIMKRLSQEITRCAQQSGHDVTPITLALTAGESWRNARTALAAMLSRGALNPADISVLFRAYTQPEPPPVHLLRIPQFLELLVDSLFKMGSKLNPEHKSKYMYLLAYSASVCEGLTPGRPVKDELKATVQAIEKVHAVCSSSASSSELIAELPTLYHCIRFPVVGMGVLVWVECVVTEPSYFKLCTEHCPVHLALLDEVASCHQLLHHRLLRLLVQLFESPQDELEILVQHRKIMEAKKSWYSLSKLEQIQFYNKYKEYQMRWKERIVECIDKAEPFMKKITMSVPGKDVISANEMIYTEQVKQTEVMNHIEDTKTIDNDVTVEQLHNNTNSPECLNKMIKAEGNDETEYQNLNTTEQLGIPDNLHTSTWSSQEQELIGLPLVEPKPPMLKSGQELYELLAMTKDNSNAETWKNLSTLKKRRYNRAVLMLKKDFIANYKLFLESLPPKDLFEYYHKTI